MKDFRLTGLFGAFVVAAILSTSLGAQVPAGGVAGGPPVAQRRAELERRFRERGAQIVRRQLKLNDDQMARLQAANVELDRQRVTLMTQERQTRQALRAELMVGDSANQQKVGGLLEQMMGFQRQRLDLQANEQRELGKFLTPVQRAKYFGLQNQLRQRMMELRDRAALDPAWAQPPMMRPRARRIFR
jgi:protein CpxP